MPEKDALEVVDSSDLTDGDWAEINRLKKAYSEGEKSFEMALDKLAKENPIRYATVMYAFDPVGTREAIRDGLAENGISNEDIRDLIARLSGRGSSKAS